MKIAHEAEDWTYAAEGNQTLVIRYTGQDPAYQGHVLRLVKQKEHGVASPEMKRASPQFCVDFIQYVIGPLIGPEYVVPQSIVHVSRPFLQAVSRKIEHERPMFRRARVIDIDQSWAFLAPDLTNGYPVAVEIKPKWGFLPSSPLIDPNHRAIKQSICRFCMHSLLKHNRTDFTYCPLDLFSGNPQRIKVALAALEHESATHGKFRIFGEWHDKQQQLTAVLQQVLLKDPLLARLQSLQRRLDLLDIEGIYPIYTKHQQEGTLPPVDSIEAWIDVVKTVQTKDDKSDWYRLYEFTLSMIFKDCSVFISITQLQQQQQKGDLDEKTNPQVVRLKAQDDNDDDQVFGYNIKLVDVDLKSMSKIPFWYHRDQDIVTHAIKMDHPKMCEQVILRSD